jgi:hypothetical protein
MLLMCGRMIKFRSVRETMEQSVLIVTVPVWANYSLRSHNPHIQTRSQPLWVEYTNYETQCN